MKRLGNLITMATLFAVAGAAHAQDAGGILVAYFSWSSSNNTQAMAEYIAEETGGTLFRIRPATPYTTNYNQVLDVAQKERAENARPALAENLTAAQMSGYDTIFIGYPVWWYDAPMIIYSFLESHNLSGKKVIPFATSGGSGLNEERKIREITGAEVPEGLCVRNVRSARARDDIRAWLDGLGLAD